MKRYTGEKNLNRNQRKEKARKMLQRGVGEKLCSDRGIKGKKFLMEEEAKGEGGGRE